MNGRIFFRADHDLVGRVLAEKLRLRAEPLPEPDRWSDALAELSEAELADEDAEREAKVSEWSGLVRAVEAIGVGFALLFLVAILFVLVGP